MVAMLHVLEILDSGIEFIQEGAFDLILCQVVTIETIISLGGLFIGVGLVCCLRKCWTEDVKCADCANCEEVNDDTLYPYEMPKL